MNTRNIHLSQQTLQTEIQPRESTIADVKDSLPELKDFDKARVEALLDRWYAAQRQIDRRLVGLVQAEQKLEQFQAGLESELDWLRRVEDKVEEEVWNTKKDNPEKVINELTVSVTRCVCSFKTTIWPFSLFMNREKQERKVFCLQYIVQNDSREVLRKKLGVERTAFV